MYFREYGILHNKGNGFINASILLYCAGGLLDDEGRMKGSVLVMDFDNKKLLEDYLESEPYIIEKVWEKVEVEAMNVVIVNGEKVGK